MSRDFTPREQHYFDTMYHTSRNRLTFTDPNSGVTTVIHDPDCDLAKACPNLYFLLPDNIIVLDKKYGKRIRPYLEKFEKILAKVIEITDREVVNDSILIVGEPTFKTKDEQVVLSWYLGNLSPGYYMTENHEVFAQYIVSSMLRGSKK